jgi:hypothetical protein
MTKGGGGPTAGRLIPVVEKREPWSHASAREPRSPKGAGDVRVEGADAGPIDPTIEMQHVVDALRASQAEATVHPGGTSLRWISRRPSASP